MRAWTQTHNPPGVRHPHHWLVLNRWSKSVSAFNITQIKIKICHERSMKGQIFKAGYYIQYLSIFDIVLCLHPPLSTDAAGFPHHIADLTLDQ